MIPLSFYSHSTDDSTPILWICNWELLSFYWWFYIYSNDDLIPILLTVFYFHSTDHSECLKASEKSSQWWNGFCWWLALQTSAEKFAMPPPLPFPERNPGHSGKGWTKHSQMMLLCLPQWQCFSHIQQTRTSTSLHLPVWFQSLSQHLIAVFINFTTHSLGMWVYYHAVTISDKKYGIKTWTHKL